MGKSKQTFRMKTVIFIFALIALASAQGVTPAAKKGDSKPAPAAKADPKPAPKPAPAPAKKDDKKPAAPAKKDDAKKPAAPAKKDDKKPAAPAKKDDKKPAAPAKKDDKKPKGNVADRNVPNCCVRDTTNGRYMPAVCGTRRFLQAAKKPDTRNDGRQTFYCPKQTAPVLNKPAAPHPKPVNGAAKKLLRRMQEKKETKEDFTCKAYARRLQAAPKPAAPAKKDDKKPAAPAKKDDKKPAAPAKKDDKKPAAPAKKDDKKPAAPSKTKDMPVSCGSKVYGTVTYTCMKTTKRDVCLYTEP